MTTLTVDVRFARPSFALKAAFALEGPGIGVLLGPSGSGKTTLMRLIAGLERPADGTVRLGRRIWYDRERGIDIPVRRRRVGIVFQDYALFENMTVAGNIGYGVPRRARGEAVATWVEQLGLEGLGARYPGQLSGGQRQRVALARALAADPDLLLLDEPFSAVDAHLRSQLRAQLMGLAAGIATPVVMVTHDPEEARRIADTVGVVVDGALRRFGRTEEVFDDPHDHEVACVLGWRNLLPVDDCNRQRLAGPWGEIPLAHDVALQAPWFGIRPEHVVIASDPSAGLQAHAVRVRELGAVRELQCRLRDGSAIFVHRPWNAPVPAPGQSLRLRFPEQHLRLLGDGERAVAPVPDVEPSGLCLAANASA